MSKFNPRQTLGTDDDAAGAESILLGQGVALAQMSVGGGSHRVVAPMVLHRSLEITAASGASPWAASVLPQGFDHFRDEG